MKPEFKLPCVSGICAGSLQPSALKYVLYISLADVAWLDTDASLRCAGSP